MQTLSYGRGHSVRLVACRRSWRCAPDAGYAVPGQRHRSAMVDGAATPEPLGGQFQQTRPWYCLPTGLRARDRRLGAKAGQQQTPPQTRAIAVATDKEFEAAAAAASAMDPMPVLMAVATVIDAAARTASLPVPTRAPIKS